MGREVKRVPVEFDWPLHEVWPGFLSPEWLHETRCAKCEGSGWSPEGQHLYDLWYGNAPFSPAMRGSVPLTADTSEVRQFAERNVTSARDFYGSGEWAIRREAERLAALWNGCWSHHLDQDDVDALAAAGRLESLGEKPTAEQVNRWSLTGWGHDATNAMHVIIARCTRTGVEPGCAECGGSGYLEKFKGQSVLADSWQRIEPPAGDGWQLWETVSEGSPVTPAFATAEALAAHLTSPTLRYEDALRWVTGPGWAPSGVVTSTGVHSNIEGAVLLEQGANS